MRVCQSLFLYPVCPVELSHFFVLQDNGGSIARLTFLYKDGPVYETLFSAGASHFMKHALSKVRTGGSWREGVLLGI